MKYIRIFDFKAPRLFWFMVVMCSVSFIAKAQKPKTNNNMSLYKQFTGLNLTYQQIGNSEVKYNTRSNAEFVCSKNNGAATSANLVLPTDAEILGVYIQWFALVKHTRSGLTSYAPLSTTIPVTFPDGTTQTITKVKDYADTASWSGLTANYEGYLADITDKVLAQANPAGTYTADVKLNGDYNNLREACAYSQENVRAWQMLVVYKSPSDEAGVNQVYVYDGLKKFVYEDISIPVSGYKVYSGNTAGSISIASLQGDAAIQGEFIDVSDSAFGSFPTDWANSGGYSNPAPGSNASTGSPYGAWDIDVKNSNFSPNTSSLVLEAGSWQDLILIDLIVLKIPTGALVVDKETTTPNVDIGAKATYKITLQNVSDVDLKGVSVADVLPSGFTYLSTTNLVLDDAIQTGTTAPSVGDTTLSWGTFDIDGNGSVTLYFMVKTDDNQAVGVYQNGATATVSIPSDTVITNYDSSSSTQDDVSVEDSCDADASGNIDTDKDGISDLCDEDDDNDGILDTVEIDLMCPSTDYIALGQSFTNTSTGTNGGSASGSTSGIYAFGGASASFSYEVINNAVWADGVKSAGPTGGVDGNYINVQPTTTKFPAGSFYPANASAISGAVYKITFTEPVYNLEFKWGGLDNDDRTDFTATIDGVNVPLTVTSNTMNSNYIVSGQSVTSVNNSGNAPSNSVVVNAQGPVTELIWFAGKDSNSNNGAVTMQLFELKYCLAKDTDDDGVPDYLDTDSDNDGCPDAVEASGNIVPSQLSTLAGGSAGGSSDNLGLVSDSEGHPIVSGSGYQQNTTAAVTDDTDYSACTADLSVTKTVSNAVPKKGSSITYTIEITNSGPLEATGVKVSDALPSGVVYASHTSTPSSATYSGGVWDIGTMAVGGSATLQIVAIVNTEDVIIENNAQVSSSNQLDVDSVINNGK